MMVSFGARWPQLPAPFEQPTANRPRVRRSRRQSQCHRDEAVFSKYPGFETQVASREAPHLGCDEPSPPKAPILKPFHWLLSAVAAPRTRDVGPEKLQNDQREMF